MQHAWSRNSKPTDETQGTSAAQLRKTDLKQVGVGAGTQGSHLRHTVRTKGLNELIPWMSPTGFHVKAKPNQELAASFRPWDGTRQKWLSAFISIYGES